MSKISYQSHELGAPAQVDSFHKLSRLQMPNDLRGKKVLDIGCNEGFFCKQALNRGASYVVGIDANPDVIKTAKDLYGSDSVEFISKSWNELPKEQFDLILWTSAMHYELNPESVLENISNLLTDNGLFILECGVHSQCRNEMIRTSRHDGTLWYPSMGFLEKLFEDTKLSYRHVGQPELVGADPVPRSVFHCHRVRPTIFLVVGESKSGKSYLAHQLRYSATKIISLDWFIARIYHSKYSHIELDNYIKITTNKDDLSGIYTGIDNDGFTEIYIDQILKSISKSDRLVIIEGFMTQLQVDTLRNKANTFANVWVAHK